MIPQAAGDDLDLLEEAVDVVPPRRVLGGSVASLAGLTVLAVAGGVALVTVLAQYVLPAIQPIAEYLQSR